tara:strand:+ start:275 stop:490 length:216 start_codon:yes stop_codon:yes gene_type:complete
MNWLIIGGLSVLSFATPIILFEIGKCSVRRELRQNINELKLIKENSNEELSALIGLHFDELKKLDKSLFSK